MLIELARRGVRSPALRSAAVLGLGGAGFAIVSLLLTQSHNWLLLASVPLDASERPTGRLLSIQHQATVDELVSRLGQQLRLERSRAVDDFRAVRLDAPISRRLYI